MKLFCSPSDTASALQVVPIEDFTNNLALSQSNFKQPDINSSVIKRRLEIL